MTALDDRPAARTCACGCGCGRPTPIAKKTDRRQGHVAGQPVRYVQGHRGPPREGPADAPPEARRCAACAYPLVNPRDEPPPGWKRHSSRGLCGTCRWAARDRGELADFERKYRSRDDVLDEWELLRLDGVGRRQAAERIGISLAALEKHIERARRDGDARAVLGAL